MAQDPAVSQFYVDFRTRLVAIRETLGYTQDDFADLLRIPRPNYPKYETRSKFPLHALPQLARLSKESIDSLVTGHGIRMFRVRVVR